MRYIQYANLTEAEKDGLEDCLCAFKNLHHLVYDQYPTFISCLDEITNEAKNMEQEYRDEACDPCNEAHLRKIRGVANIPADTTDAIRHPEYDSLTDEEKDGVEGLLHASKRLFFFPYYAGEYPPFVELLRNLTEAANTLALEYLEEEEV
jgi:hypothetical protein